MSDWRERLDTDARDRLESTPMPRAPSPMLATLTEDRFSSEDWMFERKLDGVRTLFIRDEHRARLLSRNGNRMDDTWPEIVDALEALDAPPFVADGEIVAFDGKITSFSRLQQRMGIHDADEARRSGVSVYAYLFDLLHYDGDSLEQLALRDRKRVLRAGLEFKDPLRFAAHRNGEGEAFYNEACRKGWEGVIAKRADSGYVHARSRDWLKFKCVNRQELVIGGYTEPRGERTGFGALLLGHYEDGQLVYAGKVGTGFDDQLLESLGEKLADLERSEPRFSSPSEAEKPGVHWVEPELVAEIGFTEWTRAGRLRHPRFIGLRHDKDPQDVVRERPEAA